MSDYYTPQRQHNIYQPKGSKPFKLSRSKLELFIECPRCFYIDRRLGVGRPPGFPFALNSAVDKLLKREFDLLRPEKKAHPLIEKYNVDAFPVPHEDLEEWRENFKGIQYHHTGTNLIITGAIDDLWQNSKREYIVVDYKATSKEEDISQLDKEWQNAYKRQMEIYQWLLRQKVKKVSNLGYFIYCNGRTDVPTFDAKLEFDLTLIEYKGDDSWVEQIVEEAHDCLNNKNVPDAAQNCDYCNYREAVKKVE